MTHEFKDIVRQAVANQKNGLKNVLATVVFLDGSSYRKPGVRMLIAENGTMTGAVSGGCVENEVSQRAASVFKTQEAKVITYDGRYRLGCEGVLYILIEPFSVSDEFSDAFNNALRNRESFTVESYYEQKDDATGIFGSVIHLDNNLSITFNSAFEASDSSKLAMFSQHLQPCMRLLIIGGEHDAIKLCKMASMLGWEVDVITSIKDPKQGSDFPGANSVIAQVPELIDFNIDDETAVVLMTHNYALDLKFLLKLVTYTPKYIGILGSKKRRERLFNDMLNYNEMISEEILSRIFSPAGLAIGAITPEEIALSILSEILAVTRNKETVSLRASSGNAHAN